MPPPEIWGPATWTLFHVLAEKVNERMYPGIAGQLFDIIKRLCSTLPCPECAQDATIFLRRVKIHELRSKNDFKNMIYMFHNYVNAKKRKPLYKYSDLEIYKKYNIVNVFNKFLSVYHTKGNMRLLAESFQRQLVIRSVREWFSRNICFFFPCQQPNRVSEPLVGEPISSVCEPSIVEPVTSVIEPTVGISSEEIIATEQIIPTVEDIVLEPSVESSEEERSKEESSEEERSEEERSEEESSEEESSEEEPVVEEPVVEEPVVVEEPTVEEEPLVEQHISSKEEEPLVEDHVVEEPVLKVEPVLEEPVVEDPMVEENVLSEEEATESEATESEATESEATESEATESEATESEATESEATESEATESQSKEQTKPKRGRKKKVV